MDPCEANFPGLENLEEDLKGWQWTFAKSPKFTLITGAQEVRLFHLLSPASPVTLDSPVSYDSPVSQDSPVFHESPVAPDTRNFI